jgi:hypothetical protein
MLRINVADTPRAITFRLEGRLVGPWVRELAECSRTALAGQHKPTVRVDLSEVTSLDAAGQACLQAMHRNGAELVAADCLMKAVVAEITGAPPPDDGMAKGRADWDMGDRTQPARAPPAVRTQVAEGSLEPNRTIGGSTMFRHLFARLGMLFIVGAMLLAPGRTAAQPLPPIFRPPPPPPMHPPGGPLYRPMGPPVSLPPPPVPVAPVASPTPLPVVAPATPGAFVPKITNGPIIINGPTLAGRSPTWSPASAASRAPMHTRTNPGHEPYRWNWNHRPHFWGAWAYGAVGYGYSNPYYDSGSSGYQSGSGSSSDYIPSQEPSSSGSSTGASRTSETGTSSPSSSANEEVASDSPQVPDAVKLRMDSAQRAFKRGDYADAQAQCEVAIRLLPGEINLHEFRALCQFARGNYKDAAATLHPVLAAGPGWDWQTLNSLYSSAETYTKQLRALEQSVKASPKDAATRFVLSYHYLVLDEGAAGLNQLHRIVELQPGDRVSAGIVEALERTKQNPEAARAPKPGPGR